ncbi:MAG: Ni/Fe hydrogenase subunit alpha [Candidatus Latescibacterota bacterium]|nr:MAG: Ni/Fe hydrogenase subunit alpha [Candidatus Latescibacterota bacterium]
MSGKKSSATGKRTRSRKRSAAGDRPKTRGKSRRIKVDALARVEGEGAMYVRIHGGKVKDVKLKIYEPPRFFEAFLRDRRFTEAPDITARICGICPIAYQMSACHAMEMACGVKIQGPLRDLRRLIYCAEWIESHVLHLYMLHLPDFLGYESAVHMAKDYPDEVNRALRMKKLGNEILEVVVGRATHPVNVRVGGFHRVPTRRELQPLLENLKTGIDDALETVHLTGSLEFPDYERDYEFVSVRHDDEYPFNEGRVKSNKDVDIDVTEFLDYFIEEQVAHSTSLHSRIDGERVYLVGPMARYNLNRDKLTPRSREAAKEAGLGPVCNNPFKSIIVRAVEILYSYEEAIRIIENYERPDRSAVDVVPALGPGVGHGCTEAPRGSLYHRYKIDDDGLILDARIVPPTSQNQAVIESDLYHFVERNLSLPDDKLQWRCEQAIRNYDPCISCSTHFLTLNIERS